MANAVLVVDNIDMDAGEVLSVEQGREHYVLCKELGVTAFFQLLPDHDEPTAWTHGGHGGTRRSSTPQPVLDLWNKWTTEEYE